MKRILGYLESIYAANAAQILEELAVYITQLPNNIPLTNNPDWYKAIALYSVYPDSIVYDSQLSPLKNLQQHVAHVKSLGCNALHILPFLDSPLVDKGFDVSHYFKIRPALGSHNDLMAVKNTAQQAGIQVFMDLVLNHVSEQHEWFKKAEQGDERYRDYFITTRRQPHVVRKILINSIVFAEYSVDGKLVRTNIPFPEHAGAIPNWRQGRDGYWYYHTYYPQQLDLNWFNSAVFIEIAKVMLYWASLGFHLRLDAIRYVGRPAYKSPDGYSPTTHLIISALKLLVQEVNPECVFIAETFEKMDTVISYFGKPGQIETELSYNFHLNTGLWVSIIKKNASLMWPILSKMRYVPAHAEWINFLRNHDEQSLAHLDDVLREKIRTALIKYGADFRTGCGVSGRTFALLGYEQTRFKMAYLLLASLPGSIMLPYGDEIAGKNMPMDKLLLEERHDTRNINRGIFYKEDFKTEKAQSISAWFSTLLTMRNELSNYFKVNPNRLVAEDEIFAASYLLADGEELIVFVNLSAKHKQIKTDCMNYKLLLSVNKSSLFSGCIDLPAYGGVWILKIN